MITQKQIDYLKNKQQNKIDDIKMYLASAISFEMRGKTPKILISKIEELGDNYIKVEAMIRRVESKMSQ